MYDFWYTLGVTVIQPDLLGTIDQLTPIFTFGKRIIVEFADKPTPVLRNAMSTGQLDQASTMAVRAAIVQYLKEVYQIQIPVPISIYTAGRFCQMWNIQKFNSKKDASSFADIINQVNTAYRKAAGNTLSKIPAFPALLGLCMMDANFVASFNAKQAAEVDNATKSMFAEFGITVAEDNIEFKIAKAFVAAPEFQTAVDDFMSGDLDPWTDGGTTFEQIVFWDGKSQYAIT